MSEHNDEVRERRHDARVATFGSVVLCGDVPRRGALVDIAVHGLRFRLGASVRAVSLGAVVDLEMRIHGHHASWWRLRGRVERVDDRGTITISFSDAPEGFADEVHDELLAELERGSAVRVLIVDPDRSRRAALARCLRADGCCVEEVATPLEAIASLGEPRTRADLVMIADTIPSTVADELRAYCARIDGPSLMVA